MSTPLSTATFCIADTETTGLDPVVDRVCELAVVTITAAGVELQRLESLVDPGRPVPPEASAIHHLVDEDLAGQSKLEEVLAQVTAVPFDAWVAHNANFDFQFLPHGDKPILCTYRLAKKLFPNLPKHSNQYLRYYFKLSVPEAKGLPAHRAMADVLVTSALLFHLLHEATVQRPDLMTVEALAAWAAEPILLEVCRFGSKHRDKPWSEVPKDYLEWMLKNVQDLDPDTRFSAEHWRMKPKAAGV